MNGICIYNYCDNSERSNLMGNSSSKVDKKDLENMNSKIERLSDAIIDMSKQNAKKDLEIAEFKKEKTLKIESLTIETENLKNELKKHRLAVTEKADVLEKDIKNFSTVLLLMIGSVSSQSQRLEQKIQSLKQSIESQERESVLVRQKAEENNLYILKSIDEKLQILRNHLDDLEQEKNPNEKRISIKVVVLFLSEAIHELNHTNNRLEGEYKKVSNILEIEGITDKDKEKIRQCFELFGVSPLIDENLRTKHSILGSANVPQ
jgi:hypothetical protein